MNKLHVKKNDKVIMLKGKDKGKKGKVLKVYTEDKTVLVEGINIAKRHTKPRPPKVPQGGIVEKTIPVNVSKVMLVCPHCGMPTRISYKLDKENKTRYCKKCKETI